MLLAVPNISEGRDLDLVWEIAGETALIDLHADPDHNRSVLTYTEGAATLVDVCLAVTRRALAAIDIRTHEGVHPRHGAVDVVPFVHHAGTPEAAAIDAARAFIERSPAPTFTYGAVDPQHRTLPEIRRTITSPGICVGVRPPLVAFNVNLRTEISRAREIASAVRGRDGVRALAFPLASRGLVQVSMNLTEPHLAGPAEAFRRVEALAGGTIVDAEVVGLVPDELLDQLGSLPLRAPARGIYAAEETGIRRMM